MNPLRRAAAARLSRDGLGRAAGRLRAALPRAGLAALALALPLLLGGCPAHQADPGRGRSDSANSPERAAALIYRPAFQRPYRPRYPSDATPRLTSLGDFDTPRAYDGVEWRHRGLDIAGESGDPVIAVAPGDACEESDEINGTSVVLYPRLTGVNEQSRSLVFTTEGSGRPGRTEVRIHALRIRYAHLRSVAEGIRPCAVVAMGDVIGTIGTSGIATSPHLHFEITVTDPEWLPGDPKFQGAINPFYLMRREPGEPVGSIACYAAGMQPRANAGDAENSLTVVWPTLAC